MVTNGDLAANAVSFARHIRAANLSPATQRTYLASLDRLAAFLEEKGMPTDVANIRREHLEAFIEDQLARWKPATTANRYSGIRPFFMWLEEEGEIPKGENPMARMRKPKLPEHAPPVLSEAEQERILAACRGTRPEDLRDTAIIRTFLSTGARLSEVVVDQQRLIRDLIWEEFERRQGEPDKARTAGMSDEQGEAALRAWVAEIAALTEDKVAAEMKKLPAREAKRAEHFRARWAKPPEPPPAPHQQPRRTRARRIGESAPAEGAAGCDPCQPGSTSKITLLAANRKGWNVNAAATPGLRPVIGQRGHMFLGWRGLAARPLLWLGGDDLDGARLESHAELELAATAIADKESSERRHRSDQIGRRVDVLVTHQQHVPVE
jgi:site-specific recombinase XerD